MKTKIALLLGISLFFNCSSDDGGSSPVGDCNGDISFIEEGNSWSYNFTLLGSDAGNAYFTVGACNGEGHLVDREMPNMSTGQIDNATDLWVQDGDYLMSDSNNDGDYFSKIYKRNVVVGDSWTHTKSDGTEVMHEVVAVDSLITVPAGTFPCNVFKYTTTSTINESYVCWNDEIGNVKEDGMGWYSLELTDYQVN